MVFPCAISASGTVFLHPFLPLTNQIVLKLLKWALMLAVSCQEAFQQYCHGLQAEQVLACRKPAGITRASCLVYPAQEYVGSTTRDQEGRGGVGGDEQIFSMLLLE